MNACFRDASASAQLPKSQVSSLFRASVFALCALAPLSTSLRAEVPTFVQDPRVLSEPMLQLPGEDSVYVIWYTEEPGSTHTLTYGENLEFTVEATTSKMSRMLEDTQSNLFPEVAAQLDFEGVGTGPRNIVDRGVWRHEAQATGLTGGVRVPYFVTSTFEGLEGPENVSSDTYSLQPLPLKGQPLKVVITSDQQNNRMSPGSFQRLEETIGIPDLVLFPGDFVSTPHRASEWFDRNRENNPAFFPSLQGFFQHLFPENNYKGGKVLQYAPVFGTAGNHESPGQWRPNSASIGQMDGDPQPRWYAEIRYAQKVDSGEIVPPADPVEAEAFKQQWIRDESFEQTQYFEMWNHPTAGPQGELYYAIEIGDIFLISMHVNRVWRHPNDNRRGKLTENPADFNNPDEWGFGDMFFGNRYGVGTEQYNWLVSVLESEAFQNAKYKIVLGHQTPFGAADNAIPVMAEPIATITYDDGEGFSGQVVTTYPVTREYWESEIQPLADAGIITDIYYEYPRENDIWFNEIEPLLNSFGVQLYATGHSHLWNRLRSPGGMNMIETAHYGNSFGAGYADEYYYQRRAPWARYPGDVRGGDVDGPNPEDYPVVGDPQGRVLLYPTEFNVELEMDSFNNRADNDVNNFIAIDDPNPRPLPFVDANNKLGVFTVLDTGTGMVESYVYDWRVADSEPVLFDAFSLENHLAENLMLESVGLTWATFSWKSFDATPGKLTLFSGPGGGGIEYASAPVPAGGLWEHTVTIPMLLPDELYTAQVQQKGTTAAMHFRTISLSINEILANPTEDVNGDGSFDALEDQFIEIFNDTGVAVDLGGMMIATGWMISHMVPAGTVLEDQQALVIFGGGSPAPIEGAVVQTASSGSLGLPAAWGQVILFKDFTPAGFTFYGMDMPVGASLTLDPDITGRLDPMIDHRLAATSDGAPYSPGTTADEAL